MNKTYYSVQVRLKSPKLSQDFWMEVRDMVKSEAEAIALAKKELYSKSGHEVPEARIVQVTETVVENILNRFLLTRDELSSLLPDGTILVHSNGEIIEDGYYKVLSRVRKTDCPYDAYTIECQRTGEKFEFNSNQASIVGNKVSVLQGEYVEYTVLKEIDLKKQLGFRK